MPARPFTTGPYSLRYRETGDVRHGEYSSIEDARKGAHEHASDGYDADAVDETWWYDVGIVDEYDEVVDSVTVQVDPWEPPCDEPEHEWGALHEAWGDGAGIRGTDQCSHCGLLRHWRTRPQRPDTGAYAPGMWLRYSRGSDDGVRLELRWLGRLHRRVE